VARRKVARVYPTVVGAFRLTGGAGEAGDQVLVCVGVDTASRIKRRIDQEQGRLVRCAHGPRQRAHGPAQIHTTSDRGRVCHHRAVDDDFAERKDQVRPSQTQITAYSTVGVPGELTQGPMQLPPRALRCGEPRFDRGLDRRPVDDVARHGDAQQHTGQALDAKAKAIVFVWRRYAAGFDLASRGRGSST
jgi:hypothetical protein